MRGLEYQKQAGNILSWLLDQCLKLEQNSLLALLEHIHQSINHTLLAILALMTTIAFLT